MNKLIREKPIFEMGMTAMEVVAEIVRIIPEIEKLTFMVYTPRLNVGEFYKGERSLPLEGLLSHRPAESSLWLDRDDIASVLTEEIRKLKVGDVVGLWSEVCLDDEGYSWHIPMMDFRGPDCPEFLDRIKRLMKRIRQKDGVILWSGRSYHYYGTRLTYETEWFDFLGDCGLSGLADPRYIFHAIKDRCNVLRLSACPLRPISPRVVSILD